ncbi:hypothetical protein [Altererythrobacter aquiaggeris]|uniref:hypothetical protein n=1 Tax=Aestuarierythrobacter aquiaggeris TaxID=1898396 RepID=UPI00301862ED
MAQYDLNQPGTECQQYGIDIGDLQRTERGELSARDGGDFASPGQQYQSDGRSGEAYDQYEVNTPDSMNKKAEDAPKLPSKKTQPVANPEKPEKK